MRGLLSAAFTSTLVLAVLVPNLMPLALVPETVAMRVSSGVPLICTPALVALNGDASASVFFVSIGGAMALHRTELKHVKPYDERFDVQIGTLKAIDF